MKCDANKWLKLDYGVVMTDVIDAAVAGLDPFFEGVPSQVSSGLRDAVAQLELLQRLALAEGITKEFPEMKMAGVKQIVNVEIGKSVVPVYAWQRAWSRLLEKGMIVNPPIAAVVLFDYIVDGVNKRGQVIGQTPHAKGTDFDIRGGKSIDARASCLDRAIAAKLPGVRGYKLERKNNALHVYGEAIK